MPRLTPEEFLAHPAPPLPNWVKKPYPGYTGDPLLPSPEFQFGFIKPPAKAGKSAEIYAWSNPGPQTWMQVCPYDEIVVGGSRGGSKAQPLDAQICTPFGFAPMGTMKVGSQVSNPDGTVARVIAIHPQGHKQTFTVTFMDGATTRVTGDHLWLAKRTCSKPKADKRYHPFGESDKADPGFRVFTTLELKRFLDEGKTPSHILTPLSEEVQFTSVAIQTQLLPIDPYALGLLLGDGSFRSNGTVLFTTADQELIESLKLRTGVQFSRDGEYGYRAIKCRAFVDSLIALGVYGDFAHEKFIPDSYKYTTIDVRRQILCGLMDTDGCVDVRGHCSLTTVSMALAKDVQWICRSLGYKATISTNKAGYRRSTDGVFVEGRDAHIIYIQGRNTAALFQLKRKIARCCDTFNGGVSIPHRRMTSIEPYGTEETQCITVDHPNGLYLTDDFIVTHNSWGLIAWFTSGDPMLPRDDPAHYSFLLDPNYRGLMLRKEYQSLAEFIDEAMEFYGPLGGKPKDDPVIFHFKSGAKIYSNHLGDKNAFEKFRGAGFSRIGIEELTQIEEERWYLKLLGSLRSKKQIRMVGRQMRPALRTQIMSTTNPDGPGSSWVKKRFIKVPNAAGKLIPWNTPMRDPITGLYRIFIPMSRTDNPYLRDNKTYEGMLMAQDETTRRQWMLGDWDAGVGSFFTEFRPNGPIGTDEAEKYPWARHVVDSADLKPYWYRFGGGDWGYDHPAVFHKFCRSQHDGRIHCYDELSMRQCGSFELGVALANWWLPDLEQLPDKSVTIAFSPDAFSKTDAGRTKAEQVAEGIKSVLGPYGAFLLKYSDEERAAMVRDPKAARLMFERRRTEASHGQFNLVLKSANTDRIAGWSYMHELLRFRPILQESEADLKERLKGVFATAGVEAYERELSKVKRPEAMALPKLQVWKRCHGLIRFLEEAIKDETKSEDVKKYDAIEGVGGDDGGDSCRYSLMNFKEVESQMPRAYFVSERMDSIQDQFIKDTGAPVTDPTRLIMIQQTQTARYEKVYPAAGKSFTLPRRSSDRHRVH